MPTQSDFAPAVARQGRYDMLPVWSKRSSWRSRGSPTCRRLHKSSLDARCWSGSSTATASSRDRSRHPRAGCGARRSARRRGRDPAGAPGPWQRSLGASFGHREPNETCSTCGAITRALHRRRSRTSCCGTSIKPASGWAIARCRTEPATRSCGAALLARTSLYDLLPHDRGRRGGRARPA